MFYSIFDKKCTQKYFWSYFNRLNVPVKKINYLKVLKELVKQKMYFICLYLSHDSSLEKGKFDSIEKEILTEDKIVWK